MQNNITPEPNVPYTAAQAESYGDARGLLNALIAACSAKIGNTDATDEAARLQVEQRGYVDERRRLTVTDNTAVARILRDYPARLQAVRGEST
ncbi:hypothetical protein AMK18_12055 [Streptomyces sp. CB01249]|uniref:hypothetical protein n=1 Tax=Streptomyces sp. CB01249 TaxID=1703929 RepID=UPI00093EC372|nr:hypothetical protein [Streptomyces sp. CB01249]OKJ02139.1 hypothetical protein AMK18_12055 [Streptomyces sp. CB01249]